MAWRKTLRAASFRGVRFLVDGHEFESGRRGETHEYPQRDEPYAEDLGRRARRYELEAFLLGPNYTPARDDLIKALETAGPGTLVHPYLGTERVVVRAFRLTETTGDGGKASFRITFEEAGRNQYPGGAVSSDAAIKDQAAKSSDALAADLERAFDVVGIGWLAQPAADLVTGFADLLAASNANTGALNDGLDEFTRTLAAYRSSASTKVLDTIALGDETNDLLAELARLPSSTLSSFRTMLSIGRWSPALDSVPETTPGRRQQRSNQDAWLGFVRRAAAVEAAKLVPSLSFVAREDAAAARDEITEVLDAEILAAGAGGDDESFRELSKLYAAVAVDLEQRGATLASVQTVRLPASAPALVVAHRLYQDALRDQEIVARNRVRHPSFVPGGTDLEVLTDAA